MTRMNCGHAEPTSLQMTSLSARRGIWCTSSPWLPIVRDSKCSGACWYSRGYRGSFRGSIFGLRGLLRRGLRDVDRADDRGCCCEGGCWWWFCSGAT